MKLWMLLSLLLLSILIDEAQGIRFIKGSIAEGGQHDIHENTPDEKRKLDGLEDVSLCKGKQCSSSGRIRKLTVTTTISRTTTNPKNDKNEGKKDQHKKVGKPEENLSVNSSSSKTEQPGPVSEPYPDILDLAGMDYSQARRKPPIHN